ncbi:MAG: ABC transporter ATP-binding protein [Bacilli bacterium]
MSTIALDRITKRWGRVVGLEEVTVDIAGPGFWVIYGPRGSGKSSLCRIIVGVDHPTNGAVSIDDVNVTRRAPALRGISYVPQTFALYPQFSVYDNIAYPLALHGARKRDIREQVDQIALTLGISNTLGKRPHELSGGQKQRVAIAKGLVLKRQIYVLDDPLVGLDYKIRERLVEELQTIQEDLKALFIYATSDPLEPLLLGDSIIVLKDGRVVEKGGPAALYHDPRHLTSATLGYPAANLLPGRLTQVGARWMVQTAIFEAPVEEPLGIQTEESVWVAIRAEHLAMSEVLEACAIRFKATVQLEEDIGAERVVHVVAEGQSLQAGMRESSQQSALGNVVPLGLAPENVRVYSQRSAEYMTKGIEVK